MSLHALAGHMAAKGRGSDSMLVHMTPEEVQSLQVLALRAGGTLTINPDTGLPEANFLKKLLPTIAGFALAPLTAGTSLAFLGATPLASALTVGGITGLATGSLSRGLMAGLGAYGGASLGAGLSGAGAGAAQDAAIAGLTQDQIAQQAVAQGLTEQGVLNQAAANATNAFMEKGIGSRLMEGASAAFNDPKAFVQGMGGPAKAIGTAYAAASPLMAADTVETTTPRQDTGYIRQKRFNPYTQQYVDLEPVKASEWGGRSFSDYADGGIVALAAGGIPATIDQNYVNQLVKEAATQAGGTLSYADAANAAKNLGISEDMLRSAASNTGFITGAPAPVAGPAAGSDAYNSMVGNFFSNPNVTAADVSSAMSTYGLNQADVANAMRASGLSNAAVYSAFQPDVGVPTTPLGGLAGLSSNINAALGNFRGVEGRAPTRAEAEAAMNLEGYNERDFIRATGMTLDEYFKEKKKPPVTPLTPLTLDTAGGVTPGGSGGGNLVLNPDGTVTTTPNIPGRPAGGFTGMGQVRDVYTQGGGSLGQSNLFVPKTLTEMYERYGNTGGSQQAYDYLMGKGAADIKKPVTQSGELMLPYTEAVLGQEVAAASGPATQKYIFDRRTRRYILNPAYTAAQEAAKKETPKTAVQEDMSVGAASGGVMRMALGGLGALAGGGSASQYNLGSYSDGGRLLRGPGDGVSDSIPATIGDKQPARLADGEFVVPARIVSELGNGSTEAGARKLYAMMDRVQKARGKTTGKNRVAANTRADKYLPA